MRETTLSVRGVILTGAGDKAFIAGADISELAHVAAFEAEQSSRFGQEVLDLIENLGKPVIAAINGFALGGGCETAMACTIRIAVETAKFGQPEVTLGLVPGGGGTQRLPRLVGKGRALQLILSGEMISAQEAYRIGLVNEIVPAADLITRAEAILKKDRFERSDRRQVRARGSEQGNGHEPRRRLAARSFLFRPLRRHRGQEGGHDRLPRETRPPVPRAMNKPAAHDDFRRQSMASDNIFSGLKVVDLASFIAGPSAAVILSDFGADVIKVEPPVGDLWRIGHKIPPQPQAKDAYPWHLANRNKRGMTLDLKSPSAQPVLEKLVKWADVLIVNTPHPARKKLKLEYDDVAQWNPRLIYADVTGFGENGPDAESPGLRHHVLLGAQRLALDDARCRRAADLAGGR